MGSGEAMKWGDSAYPMDDHSVAWHRTGGPSVAVEAVIDSFKNSITRDLCLAEKIYEEIIQDTTRTAENAIY